MKDKWLVFFFSVLPSRIVYAYTRLLLFPVRSKRVMSTWLVLRTWCRATRSAPINTEIKRPRRTAPDRMALWLGRVRQTQVESRWDGRAVGSPRKSCGLPPPLPFNVIVTHTPAPQSPPCLLVGFVNDQCFVKTVCIMMLTESRNKDTKDEWHTGAAEVISSKLWSGSRLRSGSRQGSSSRPGRGSRSGSSSVILSFYSTHFCHHLKCFLRWIKIFILIVLIDPLFSTLPVCSLVHESTIWNVPAMPWRNVRIKVSNLWFPGEVPVVLKLSKMKV